MYKPSSTFKSKINTMHADEVRQLDIPSEPWYHTQHWVTPWQANQLLLSFQADSLNTIHVEVGALFPVGFSVDESEFGRFCRMGYQVLVRAECTGTKFDPQRHSTTLGTRPWGAPRNWVDQLYIVMKLKLSNIASTPCERNMKIHSWKNTHVCENHTLQ